MNKPTIQKIHDVLKANNFVVFTETNSANLGGIRTKDNTSGKFNDFLYCFYFDEKKAIQGIVIEATTDAGIHYRVSPMNKNGTAVLVHNRQYRGVYQLMDKGHSGTKAFRQIKPMDYWRDNNKDKALDFKGEIHTENALTNIHYMGKIGNDVDKWSAGCQGATISNLNKLMAVAEKQKGRVYSYVLLHEELFNCSSNYAENIQKCFL